MNLIEKILDKTSSIKREETPSKEKFFYSATELLNMRIMEIPMLWGPFLPAKGLAGFTGSSETGKSTFLRQLAMAVSTNRESFLGYPLSLKHRRALYICTEDDKEVTASLLRDQAANGNPLIFQTLHFMFDGRNLMEKIDLYLQKIKVDLVVLDVWSDTFNGNPNNWVEVRQNLSRLKFMADKYECLIIILHHTVKNSEKSAPDKNKLNGSQAIEAKLRSLLELRNGALPNERVLYVLKNNYMPREQKQEGIQLIIDNKTKLFENSGNKVAVSSGIEGGGKIYDTEIWVPRMNKLRGDGLSYDAGRKQLIEEFGEEAVPGLTWFKNNCKEDSSQSNIITKESD